MPTALVKLVAMLLLVVQAVVGIAPGQVLCIQVADCGSHSETETEVAACRHCSDSCCESDCDQDACCEHEQPSLPVVNVPAGDCGCHVHVRIPAAKQVAAGARDRLPQPSLLFGPAVAMLAMSLDCSRPRPVVWHPPPPNFEATDQSLSLRATRLLI